MSMHNLGIPDLPLRAFVRHGRNILPQGKGSTPKTPDYEALAREQSAGNLEMAKYATQANRVNQYTPWGNLTWTNNRTFDQAGYDAAMQQYEQSVAEANNRSPGGPPPDSLYALLLRNSVEGDGSGRRDGGGSSIAAPDRNNFYTADNWQQTVSLSPEMQALFDQEMALQQGLFGAQDKALGRVNQMMGTGFDMSGIPTAGVALDPGSLPGMGTVYDPEIITNNATELLMRRLAPEMDRQNEQLRSQLANQGITQGSQAYNTAMGQFGQQRNDAATQAALQGITLGMQQQGMQFGQQNQLRQLAAALQNQQFAQSEQARARAMQEQAYLRNLPLNELNSLRTGNQVSMPQFPSYAQQATTGGPDLVGAANNTYNAQMGAYNAQQAGNAGMMGGLLGLGSLGLQASGAGLFGIAGGIGSGNLTGGSLVGSSWGPAYSISDRRLKRNIRRVGTADNGLGIYSYQYVWGGPTQIGYMADEVETVSPEAVITMPSGYKAVDYARV